MATSIAPPPPLNKRQQARENRIIAIATAFIARFGRARLTPRILAEAMCISPAALRWHFADIDALIGEILRRHLNQVIEALTAIPEGPHRAAAMRQAAEAARSENGVTVPAYTVLLEQLAALPEDLRVDIEALNHRINALLGTVPDIRSAPVPTPAASQTTRLPQTTHQPPSSPHLRPGIPTPPHRMNTPPPLSATA
jgi:AcrR family transcriptional regulator